MELMKNNFIILIIVGLFLVFALIGYLIDTLRNQNEDETKVEIPDEIKSIELTKVIENNQQKNENKKDSEEDSADDLLKNYDEE